MIPDQRLCDAARRIDSGLVDADLGGGVLKQRLARSGHGKSGGFRCIVLFRPGGHIFFADGFAKNEKGNVAAHELLAFRKLASHVLRFDDHALQLALKNRTFLEIYCHD